MDTSNIGTGKFLVSKEGRKSRQLFIKQGYSLDLLDLIPISNPEKAIEAGAIQSPQAFLHRIEGSSVEFLFRADGIHDSAFIQIPFGQSIELPGRIRISFIGVLIDEDKDYWVYSDEKFKNGELEAA